MTKFKSLGLMPEILKQLEIKGYTTPTPIQNEAIPHLLKGHDLLGIAQTGTGKTAAFSLPILNKIGQHPVKIKPKHVRVLILTPTRELASQIEMNIKEYGKSLGVKTRVVFGGVGKTPQVDAIKKGLDFLIATPGRLLDLMSEGHINYSQLDTLILDEADTMLDMGFLKDVQRIIEKIPKTRQTLLFSATMPKDIGTLAETILKNPKKVEVTPESTVIEKIEQEVYFVDKADKLTLLLMLLESNKLESVLIFCKTKFGANRVAEQLEKLKIPSAAIHSNKSQNAREKALESFRKREIRVLVATDIAARGIDVKEISHVINFNLPEDPSNYVHRIGRTARAGKEGKTISLCIIGEYSLLKNIEKVIKQEIPKIIDHPYHKNFTAEALQEFSKTKAASKTNGRSNRGRPRPASKSSPKKNKSAKSSSSKRKVNRR